MRQDDWKLIRFFHDGPKQEHRYELYNLRDDLSETRNLAAAQPGRVKELDALLEGFLKDTGALVPGPNPAYTGAVTESRLARRPARRLESPALRSHRQGRHPYRHRHGIGTYSVSVSAKFQAPPC